MTVERDAFLLALGVTLAALGGNFFVRGSVGLAGGLKVPAGIIGATIAAFATSSPELAVAVNSAIAGTPNVALGDALGSNVGNVALILGIALAFGGMRPERGDIRRDLPVAVMAPLLIAILALDGLLSRIDGAVLFTVFAGWLATAILQAKRARDAAEEVLGVENVRRALVETGAGMGLLIVAGRLIVLAARGFGVRLGLDPFLVGATLVAFGTSVPELAATLIARMRGRDEVGIGTILGSNIFNSLWIVGLVSLLHPVSVQIREMDTAIAASSVATLLLIPNRQWILERWRSPLLMATYAAYIGMVAMQ